MQAADGLHLLLCRLHRLIQIGAVAVQAAVHAIPQVLFQLGGHHVHGRHGCANQRQKVLDLVALLEIGNEAAAPAETFGRIAALLKQRI